MKKILVVLVALALAAKAWFWFKGSSFSAGDSLDFSNPVYAQIRGSVTVGDRKLEEADLVKTANQQDCELQLAMLDELYRRHNENELAMHVDSKSCDSTLPPHLAKTFDNIPSDFTYLSAARGAFNEREVRAIIWGVTADESQAACDFVIKLPMFRDRKGAVTCVRPNR